MAEPALSAREREVLTLVAQGLSTADIAARLHISSSTVASHMRRVRRVLGMTTRQWAVVVARERGLLLGPPAPSAGPVVATPDVPMVPAAALRAVVVRWDGRGAPGLIGELKRLLAGAGRAS